MWYFQNLGFGLRSRVSGQWGRSRVWGPRSALSSGPYLQHRHRSAGDGWNMKIETQCIAAGPCGRWHSSDLAPRPPACPTQHPCSLAQATPAAQDSQEEEDPCVSHGIGQSQDATAHDGVAEIEHGHSKRCLPFELRVRARPGTHGEGDQVTGPALGPRKD